MAWLLAFLNQNSAAVTAVATVVIAVASCINARIVSFEKRREKAARMPILTFEEQLGPGGTWRDVYVKNIGYGPALNIVRKVLDAPNFVVCDRDKAFALGALGPTEKVYALAATQCGVSGVSILDDPRFHAVVECDDVHGEHYEFVYKNRILTLTSICRRRMTTAQASRI